MTRVAPESPGDAPLSPRGGSLQRKAWVITAGVLLGLAALLAVGVDWVFRNTSRALETQWVAECIRRVQAAQAAEIDALERSARDYANWSDTYEFVMTSAPEYVENNLIASMFTNLQVDAFLIFDLQGALHTGRTFRDGEVSTEGVAEVAQVLAPFARRASQGTGTSAKGAVRMGDAVLFFGALPILRDDTSGPPRGALAKVRVFGPERVAHLRETLNLDLQLKVLNAGQIHSSAVSNEPSHHALSDEEMLAIVPVIDGEGEVIATWEITLPRDIHQQGVQARLVFYVVMCVLILAATWVIGRLLRSMVIARLEALHSVVREVGSTSDLSARVPLTGSDELTELASGINRMFDALARSEAKRVAAEAEQERLNRQLQQAQKMEAIGTLTGGLAHDFNNLLTSIQGSAALIRLTGAPGEDLERHLKRIEQASAHGAGLVRQMMAFGRRTPTVFTTVRLSDVMREALQLLRASIPRGVQIEFQSEAENDWVYADVGQLQQVMINLGTNSAHAMAGGHGRLSVRILATRLPDPSFAETATAPAGDYLRIEIADTGCGIAPENLSRIFEPFFTTKPVGSGTGLGLAVVHGIVTQHHGTIGVSSQLGQGTTFVLHLPRSESAKLPQRAVVERVTRDARPSDKPLRVMLVDDDAMVRETLVAGLKRLGYDVLPVSSGPEALKALDQPIGHVDLMVTDQMMPGMTGSELGQRVLSQRPDLPLVLITGYASALNEEKVKAMGFRAMLMKPVTLDLLDRTLRAARETAAAEML